MNKVNYTNKVREGLKQVHLLIAADDAWGDPEIAPQLKAARDWIKYKQAQAEQRREQLQRRLDAKTRP